MTAAPVATPTLTIEASALVALLIDGGATGSWAVEQCRNARLLSRPFCSSRRPTSFVAIPAAVSSVPNAPWSPIVPSSICVSTIGLTRDLPNGSGADRPPDEL